MPFSVIVDRLENLGHGRDAHEAHPTDDEGRDHPYARLYCPGGLTKDLDRLNLDLRPSLTKLLEQRIRELAARSKGRLKVQDLWRHTCSSNRSRSTREMTRIVHISLAAIRG